MSGQQRIGEGEHAAAGRASVQHKACIEPSANYFSYEGNACVAAREPKRQGQRRPKYTFRRRTTFFLQLGSKHRTTFKYDTEGVSE